MKSLYETRAVGQLRPRELLVGGELCRTTVAGLGGMVSRVIGTEIDRSALCLLGALLSLVASCLSSVDRPCVVAAGSVHRERRLASEMSDSAQALCVLRCAEHVSGASVMALVRRARSVYQRCAC